MSEERPLMLPAEIIRFLDGPGGHSLIIRGNAGTGKTTFTLQLAEEFKDRQEAHYLSTRVSDGALLNQFPWLKDRLLKRTEVDIACQSRSGLGKLKGIHTGEIITPRREMTISIGRTMPDVERIYEVVEGSKERRMVIVDSIDALADRYDLNNRELMIALQRDLVESKGANIVLVLESNDYMLDYLGDGVVEFTRREHDRRLIREMDLMKLRGCEIQQPLYIYSLKGGRFQCFGADWDAVKNDIKKGWNVTNGLQGRISYGIEDLDLMTGGMTPGEVVLFEFGQGMPTIVGDLLERSLVSNFANSGRGVIWVPLRKTSGSTAKNVLHDMIPDDVLDRTVRVIEPASQMDSEGGRFVLPVEGSNVINDLKWKNLAFSLDGAAGPFLSLIGMDTLESIYGGDVMEGLVEHLAAIRKNGGVFVGMTTPTSRSTARLADMATVHIKAERIGGTVVFYGSKPFTECYALRLEHRAKGGCGTLTPLV